MVATTAGTAGNDNQGEYSEQKIEKKSEIKRSKGWGWENGKTEEENMRQYTHPRWGKTSGLSLFSAVKASSVPREDKKRECVEALKG